MRVANSGVDYVSAPTDYADLFSKYYKYVVSLVQRMGIHESRAEDVASEILLRFYERDFLPKFDPTLVFQYAGEDRPARFKSFLSKFVLTYLRGHWDRQQRETGREMLICDMPVGNPATQGDTGASTWLDVFGGAVPDHEEDVLDVLMEQQLVDQLRAYVATVPRRSRFDNCDLVALFDEVVDQIRANEQWSVPKLCTKFHISPSAMHGWMWWLRANLAAALGRPVPPKRLRVSRK